MRLVFDWPTKPGESYALGAEPVSEDDRAWYVRAWAWPRCYAHEPLLTIRKSDGRQLVQLKSGKVAEGGWRIG